MRLGARILFGLFFLVLSLSTTSWGARKNGSMTENGGYVWTCADSSFVTTPSNSPPAGCNPSLPPNVTKSFLTTTSLLSSYSSGGLELDVWQVDNCGSCLNDFGANSWTHLELSGAGPLTLYITDPGTWGFVGCAGNVLPGEEAAYHCGEPASPNSQELSTQFLITLPGSGSIDLYGYDGNGSDLNSLLTDSQYFFLEDGKGNSVGDLSPESVPSVPEPSTIALLAAGLIGVASKLGRR